MAKWLKEGIDAGGFAIKKEEKEKGEGKEIKEKENTMGASRTHLLNFLILKKRQHWEWISHWFDLKRRRKKRNSKKKKKTGKKKYIYIEMQCYFKETRLTCLFG